jgi:hypothetical protein
MSNPNFQIKLGTAGATSFQADSTPLAAADANDRPGWVYTKSVAGGDGATDKFNWYMYAGTYENMTCADVESMWFYGSVDQFQGQADQVPFIVLYTKPKGDGSDQEVWYHSRHAYSLHLASNLVRAGEKCLWYCLNEPREKFNGARQIPLRTRTDTGTYDASNEVLYMTLHSDSDQAEVVVYVENLGADMRGFDRIVSDNTINMKLVQ